MPDAIAHPSNLIQDYGARFPREFGGMYMEAGRFVVLFTSDLPTHAAALRELVHAPDEVVVRRAARSWGEVRRSNEEVARKLLGDGVYPGITTVGISVEDEQFVVSVGVHPFDRNIASEIARVVQPHQVVVRERGPARYV